MYTYPIGILAFANLKPSELNPETYLKLQWKFDFFTIKDIFKKLAHNKFSKHPMTFGSPRTYQACLRLAQNAGPIRIPLSDVSWHVTFPAPLNASRVI